MHGIQSYTTFVIGEPAVFQVGAFLLYFAYRTKFYLLGTCSLDIGSFPPLLNFVTTPELSGTLVPTPAWIFTIPELQKTLWDKFSINFFQ